MQSVNNNKNGMAAIYCRLSSDDGREGESNSIINQKALLEKFAQEKELGQTKTYVDDGFTGTNFNRPAFQSMIEDIEKGYIHTVLVKDLSRLGRDYVNVGYYTDSYFVDRDVRFIAVNDLVDSDDGENELAPFKNIMNEMYARDTSRKVRSAHRIRGNLGDPLCQPPYGYMKDPENPKKWVIDPEVAHVVKMIFQYCIEGKGVETTARLLQEQEILTPAEYKKYKCNGSIRMPANGKSPYKWCKSGVNSILTKPEYTGDLVNFKTYSKSYKNRKRLENPPENWKVFPNHHEALIDRETFELVQKSRKKAKRRKPKNVEKNMFADLLFCADCGSKLWFNVNTNNPDIHYFRCSNYKSDRGTCPTTHYIRADALEHIVTLEVAKMIRMLEKDKDRFVELLSKKTETDMKQQRHVITTKLNAAKARFTQVSDLYERVYEDNVIGKINDERFMQLSHKYDVEQSTLKVTIAELEKELEALELSAFSKERFLATIDNFMKEPKLTAHILRELIEKIEVYHAQGTGKDKTQRLVIHYRFIGVIEMPQRKHGEAYNPIKDYPSPFVLETRQGVVTAYHVKAS